MTSGASPSAARASWDLAPCGLLTLHPDGTVADANPTALEWMARERDDVVERLHLTELLTVGGRIYWETHLFPLLHVERRVEEVAVELRAPGGRVPVLLTAVAQPGADGSITLIHVALSSARERARYEQELRRARTEAEHSLTRLRALQRVTAALAGAVGVDGVAAVLLADAVRPVGARAGTLWLCDPELGLQWHGSTGEAAEACEIPALDRVRSLREAVVSAGRVVVPLHGPSSLQGVLSLLPHHDPGAEVPGIAVPDAGLLDAGLVDLGLLDLGLLTAVGRQAGLALERARLHERAADVAHELQRSLLAVEPPSDARYAVAATYRPGVEELEVGGDWYDIFSTAPDVLAVVVGDVVGRGLHAASAMGQLRSALRAVAGPDVSPSALLALLDRFVEQVEAAALATVGYAELDLAAGSLSYACAGHLPPLLLPAQGEPGFLWQGRSTPLGVLPSRLRGQARVQLAPGDRLLLCTDGLVERRDRDLDAGLGLLLAAASRWRDAPVELAVQNLTRELLADEHGRDDVCVLLVEWIGPATWDRSPAAG